MPVDYRKLLVQHLDLIDRIVLFVARRRRLSPADTEEFASVVRLKLVDRDFAILRKFKRRSALSTYMTIVIERLCLDFCIAKWGKWRPSASARRLGPVALLLEQLIIRDGVTFDEAVGTLQTNHGVNQTREELHALFLQLPPRPTWPPGGESSGLASNATSGGVEFALEHQDDRVTLERIEAALVRAVSTLEAEDRLILKLRFEDGRPVAQIARTLGLRSRPLYRRIQHIIAMLRAELVREGVDEVAIAAVVGHPALALEGVLVDADSG
jgi:RNA polymerase sigma factor (sigma-70 family)